MAKVGNIVSVIKPKSSWHRWLPLIVVGLIIIAAVLAVVLSSGNSSGGGIKPAHMVFNDNKNFSIITTDQAAKQQYKIGYQGQSNVSFEASSPSGQQLYSLNVGDPKATFVWIKDQKVQSLSAAATSALRGSIVLNNHHDIFFSGEGNVVYFDCTSTCKLMSMDLASAKTQTIYDTALKQSSVSPVYLLGVSADGKTAYVRALDKSKLGDKAGIYSVGLSSKKVINTYPVSSVAGYSVALSPDSQKAAYVIGLTNKTYEIHVMSLTNGADNKVVWKTGALAGMGVFSWSPDNSKVLFQASDVNLPRAQFDAGFPINLAYLDVLSNKIVDLGSIGDSAHNYVGYLGWLSTDTIAYQQDKTSLPYIFAHASGQAYSMNITAKTPTKIGNPNNRLIQVVRY